MFSSSHYYSYYCEVRGRYYRYYCEVRGRYYCEVAKIFGFTVLVSDLLSGVSSGHRHVTRCAHRDCLTALILRRWKQQHGEIFIEYSNLKEIANDRDTAKYSIGVVAS